jgi:phosphoribosylamine--glycine ligase
MKILVIGSGGREHALVWSLAHSSVKPELYCAPGNGGIARLARCVSISGSDIPGLKNFVKTNRTDFTVVGPEEPLVQGIVDEFKKDGLVIFGPQKQAARLEGDKTFAKTLMRNYGIPTADFEIFTESEKAKGYIDSKNGPWVIKASGLAYGKGVTVARSKPEAYEAVDAALVKRVFGEAGKTVVIEDCLVGEEASIVALTDGETVLPLLPSQDHKALADGDQGPNTGGMGAYTPAPVVDENLAREILIKILKPTLAALKSEGIEYRGVLYAGIMVTETGPSVLEFNCRFGDPETQTVLPLVASDLVQALYACATGSLKNTTLSWHNQSAVCVVAASRGYPGSYEKGKTITGELSDTPDVAIFHAGTKLENGRLVTSGGRVLGVTGIAPDLTAAKEKAYAALTKIKFEGMYFRTDIADKGIRRLRESH